MAAKLPLGPSAVYALVRELRAEAAEDRPIVVGGVERLAGVLRRELEKGGDPHAVRGGDPDRAAALVYVLAGEPGEDDRRVLRAAHRARVPVVAVVTGPLDPARPIPYVLATDVVRVPPGSGFPVEEIARALARGLGDAGAGVAARLPVLRQAVCSELIQRASRRNGVLGAAVFVPGADLPVLTLNQLRMVLRIGKAYGVEVDRERLPEVVAVIGSGFGFRAVARELLDLVPIAGWALKGAVAYLGTRALGEAAVRYFEARTAAARAA